mmetsp:Transcript_7455/g.24560  ORF Transcript_7455/g.24560 Transcript_7455/m.24560 type:complete len:205 (-) Transcript_7455:1204-1818(-)
MRLACGRTPDTLTAVVARAARTWVTCSNVVHMHASLRNVVGNRRYARLLARRRVLQHPLPERLRLRPWLCALPGAVSLPAAAACRPRLHCGCPAAAALLVRGDGRRHVLGPEPPSAARAVGCVAERLCEGRGVLEGLVGALAGGGVESVRRVAEQRHAPGCGGPGRQRLRVENAPLEDPLLRRRANHPQNVSRADAYSRGGSLQ